MGQAIIELTFVTFMLVAMLFGLIDFGRIIYEKQILVNVSREGANLASRGSGTSQMQIMSNAAGAVIVSASPLSLTNNGEVIISAVSNSNNILKVTAQVSEGQFGAASKIGAVGSTPHLPNTGSTTFPASNQTIYVTEVFYKFSPITPLFKLMSFTLPSTNYDVAYF